MQSELSVGGEVTNPQRLAALKRTGLPDTPPEPAFDRLTALARRTLNVPVVLLSLVDDRRQFFKSQSGLPDSLASIRETPLSHSFCRYVVAGQSPFSVEDARQHPLVRDNGAVDDLGVIAYLGVPLRDPEGQILGSFCAIDHVPRHWTTDEAASLTDFADLARAELTLRLALDEARKAQERLCRAERAMRQQAESCQRQHDALQEFVSTASHDLREPLRKILQFGNLIRRQPGLPPSAGQYLERLLAAGDRMHRLLADLLTYSRLASLAQPTRPVYQERVVADAVDILEARYPGLRTAVRVAPLPTVEGDPNQLHQLFVQLLDNAGKFRRTDVPLLIDIAAEPVCRGQVHYWQVTVRDNGIGFEAGHAERIFGVFERLHAREDFPGTGMGLAICRRIAERHSGTLTATGAPNVGAAFVLLLPVEPSEKVEIADDFADKKTNARVVSGNPEGVAPPPNFASAPNTIDVGVPTPVVSPTSSEER
ncbi:MAG: ATP-binding protein [Capsulimonadales bacterium]|nr:ATP-binding protein [Capsulimonadales bacterium]